RAGASEGESPERRSIHRAEDRSAGFVLRRGETPSLGGSPSLEPIARRAAAACAETEARSPNSGRIRVDHPAFREISWDPAPHPAPRGTTGRRSGFDGDDRDGEVRCADRVERAVGDPGGEL